MANLRMPKLPLNHDASVPIDEAAPFTITAAEPIVAGFKDYIPSKARLEKAARHPPQYQRTESNINGPVFSDGADFIPYEKSLEITKERDKRIDALAEEILKQNAERIARFEKAKAAVKAATDDQKENPDKALRAAMAIVAKGRPIDKQKAVAEATNRLNRKN